MNAARPRRAAGQERLAERRRGRRRSTSPARASSTSRVDAGAQGEVAARRRRRRARRTARSDAFAGEKVNLEFVSANPTGPLHIGGARWAAVGDALGRVLRGDRRRGHPRVLLQRPRRPDRPVRPVAAGQRARARPAPEDGYGGAYIAEIADRRRRGAPRRPRPARRRGAGGLPRRRRRADVRGDQADAARLRGRLRRLLPRERPARERRRRAGDRPAAPSWATPTSRTARSGCAPRSSATTRTGSSSSPTASRPTSPATCAYYLDKRERGFDRCIIMLGADHHGYVGRMMAMCAAFGDEPGREPRDPHRPDGQPAQRRRSRCGCRKRAGTVVTLDDLVEAIGVDAAPLRAGPLLRRLHHRHRPRPAGPRQTNDNPVFYVQYAHARVCRRSLRNAADLGLAPRATTSTRRCSPHEKRGRAARARSPSSRGSSRRRPSCASRTGSRATSRTPPATYHRFYDNCRVLPMGDEEATDLHRARLLLVDATRTVLANGLAPARRLRARSGCSACAPTRPAGRTPTGALRGPAVAARSPPTPTRWSRTSGRTTAHKDDGVLSVGGRRG